MLSTIAIIRDGEAENWPRTHRLLKHSSVSADRRIQNNHDHNSLEYRSSHQGFSRNNGFQFQYGPPASSQNRAGFSSHHNQRTDNFDRGHYGTMEHDTTRIRNPDAYYAKRCTHGDMHGHLEHQCYRKYLSLRPSATAANIDPRHGQEQRNSPPPRMNAPAVSASERTPTSGFRQNSQHQPREPAAVTASQIPGSRSNPYQPRRAEVPASTEKGQTTYQPRGTAPTRGSTHAVRQVLEQPAAVSTAGLPVISEEGESEVKSS